MDAVIFVVPGGRNRAVCNRSRRPMDVVASDPFAQKNTPPRARGRRVVQKGYPSIIIGNSTI
jgi:hypothetical protein